MKTPTSRLLAFLRGLTPASKTLADNEDDGYTSEYDHSFETFFIGSPTSRNPKTWAYPSESAARSAKSRTSPPSPESTKKERRAVPRSFHKGCMAPGAPVAPRDPENPATPDSGPPHPAAVLFPSGNLRNAELPVHVLDLDLPVQDVEEEIPDPVDRKRCRIAVLVKPQVVAENDSGTCPYPAGRQPAPCR